MNQLNQPQDKVRIYKDQQSRLWVAQQGIIAGKGTTPTGAMENMRNKLRCPLTLYRARQVQ